MRYLLDVVDHENKLYLDLERIEYRKIFQKDSFLEMKADLEFLGYDFSKAGVIALDEVQLLPEVTSFVKYYHDHSDTKFILSGSSSYYLKNKITESLAGRKRVFEIYPLTFFEFLQFKEEDTSAFEKQRMKPFRPIVYSKFQKQYEEYIQYGGFPQVVLQSSHTKKEHSLKDILNSYLELDVKILSDYSVIDDLFRLVTLLTSRIGNKLDYQKLSVLSGIARHKIKEYMNLFEATYFVHIIRPFSTNPDRQITVQPKLYIADNGFVNQLSQVSSGALFENSIANQLLQFGEINYFQKKNGQEIDFILNKNHAYEVKETPSQQDLQTLQNRAGDLGIEQKTLIGRYAPAVHFDDFVWGGCVF